MPHDDKTYPDTLVLNNHECRRLLSYLNARIDGTARPSRADDLRLYEMFDGCLTLEGARPLYYEETGGSPALLPTAPPVPLLCSQRESAWLAAALEEPQAKALLGDALQQKLKLLLPAADTAPLQSISIDHSSYNFARLADLTDVFAFFTECICSEAFFTAINDTSAGPRPLEGRAYYIQYDRLLDAFYLIGWSTQLQTTFQARLDRIRDYAVIDAAGRQAPADLWEHYNRQRLSMTVEVANHRNAVHRFCSMFAGCERYTRFNRQKGVLEITLYYHEFETKRMLRHLLTLGSSVRVLQPQQIRRQLYEIACAALEKTDSPAL